MNFLLGVLCGGAGVAALWIFWPKIKAMIGV